MNANLNAFKRVLDPADNQTGGGTASAVAAAMGAALVGMVARLSIGRKGLEPEEFYRQIDAEAQLLAKELFNGASADSQAFDAVMSAYRSPKGTAEERASRTQAIQQAIIRATRVPLANAQHSARTLSLCAKLVGRSNTNAASDLDCARYLAQAGLLGSLSNVRANLESIKDGQIASEVRGQVEALQALIDEISGR